MISIFYLHFNKRSVLYRETRYPSRIYTRAWALVYVWVRASNSPRYWYKQGAGPSWSVLCNQGPINIEGGQSVRERCPVRAGHLRLFARPCHAFCSYPSYPDERYHALTSSSRGARTCRATYETSNYAKTRSDTNDGYTRPITRITTMALFVFDRPAFFFVTQSRQAPDLR